MIYYIYKLTNTMFQSINYFIVFYFKKIYELTTNYFISYSNNLSNNLPDNLSNNLPIIKPIDIEKNKFNFKVIKSISYNILPNSFIKNPILLDIYESNDIESLVIFNFDYNVKYLSSDRLYGWYIDIEEKEKFISHIK